MNIGQELTDIAESTGDSAIMKQMEAVKAEYYATLARHFCRDNRHLLLRHAVKELLAALQNGKADTSGILAKLKQYTDEPLIREGGPIQDESCSQSLVASGKPYPRTCKTCGLGPCKL